MSRDSIAGVWRQAVFNFAVANFFQVVHARIESRINAQLPENAIGWPAGQLLLPKCRSCCIRRHRSSHKHGTSRRGVFPSDQAASRQDHTVLDMEAAIVG